MDPSEPTRFVLTRRRFRAGHGVEQVGETGAIAAPKRIRRIVLTGGPGSGKSTATSFLSREFADDLWVLPEAATLLYRGGMPRGQGDIGVQIAQRAIYNVQRALERATSVEHPDRVQLCDRGCIDGAAYWPGKPDSFFASMGTTHTRELANYDAVIFLHTAAMLPAGYERDVDVRVEDAREAIDLDRRLFALYADHPNLIAIESRGSFLDKLTAVRNAVSDLVHDGAPGGGGGARTTRKFRALEGGIGTVTPAPMSSLMGLASVQQVLPVD